MRKMEMVRTETENVYRSNGIPLYFASACFTFRQGNFSITTEIFSRIVGMGRNRLFSHLFSIVKQTNMKCQNLCTDVNWHVTEGRMQ